MPSTIQRNATDTWTNADRPSRNYADARTLHVRSADRFGYLFLNRAAPLGATVTGSTLRLVYASNRATAATLEVQRLAERWKVSRTTHQNRPAVTGTSVSITAPAGPAGTVVELDVTSHMQSVSNGAAWYGWRISSGSTALNQLGSANGASAYRPSLEVAWTEAPDAPSTLVPAGNQAVSTPKPVLSFDFTDTLGDTALQAVQVQIDAAANWTAPAWDSGVVAAVEPELALASTTYAGLASGASTWWRVRVQDGAGLWSDWSDDQQFKYLPLGTVTIDNPAAAPNNVTTEPTPPFLWTPAFVQTAWRVVVVDDANPSTTLADSGKRLGTATAWTPSAALPGDGPYRVSVRAWDGEDRVAVSNGSDAASAVRTFSMATDPATVGVTGLVVTQPTQDKPVQRLEWQRATAPDSFVVRRDGVVTEAELLPGDVLASGTTYTVNDDTAAPWRSHTWEVQAVVNGKASDKASVTYTPQSRGIWLLDGTSAVWLAGDDSGSIAQAEEATVLLPLGATYAVRRIQSQRGYEGSLSGIFTDRAGLTALQAEANLRTMRGNPTEPVVLVVGDLALRVVLGNVTISPTSVGTPPRKVATFEFWEAPA